MRGPLATRTAAVAAAAIPAGMLAAQEAPPVAVLGAAAAQVDAARGGRPASRYVPIDAVREGRTRLPAVFARRVTVVRERVLLQHALMDIATQAGLGLSYGDDVVRAAPRVTLDLHDVSAVDAIAAAARGTGFTVLVTDGGQVAVVRDVAPARALAAVVAGAVTDSASRRPLSGVQITIEGGAAAARLGAVTGDDGRYRIGGVPVGAVTVVARRIGYAPARRTVTVADGQTATADFVLAAQATALQEVVAVGYTNETRRTITGAVASVSAEQLAERKTATLEDALRGKIAGVNIQSTGAPGQPGRVLIRGVNFVGGNTSPLYVVDGMYSSSNPNLNPDDIASIQVLKDASAAAQYGARGANGVVLITTKRGRAGETRLSLQSFAGSQAIPRLIPMAGSDEWLRITEQAYTAPGAARPTGATTALTNPPDTDWQRALTQNGAIQSHNLTVSGGSERGAYLLSGGYLDQTGALIRTGFDRANLRVNSDFRRGRLTFGENLTVSRSNRKNLVSSPLVEALRMPPVVAVYDSANLSGFGYGTDAVPTFGTNPVGLQALNDSTRQVDQGLGSVFAQAQLFKGLSYRFNLGFQYETITNSLFTRSGALRLRNAVEPARLGEERDTRTALLYENLLTYDQALGRHTVSAVAGYTEQTERFEGLAAGRRNFPDQGLTVINAGTTDPVAEGSVDAYAIRSYLARATYSFADRYLLTGSFRRDGSSRFGPLNRYANFGSGSVGWVVSEERFFRSVPAVGRRVDQLKLRASYGKLGDQGIPNYQYSGLIADNQSYVFGSGQALAPGATNLVLANPAIRWQDNESRNLGVDLVVGPFTAAAEYYVSTSGGLLVQPPIAASVGARQGPFVNLGNVRNRGVELELGHSLRRGGLTLNSSANFTTIDNKVLSLGNDNAPIVGARGVTRTAVGGPIGAFYVLRTQGLFQSDAEVQAHATTLPDGTRRVIQPAARPGDVRFADLNGDGQINADDRYVAGSPFSDFEGGLYLNASYRRFDLNLGLRGSRGSKVWNGSRFWTDRMDDLGGYRAGLNPWTPTNTNTSTPRAVFGTAGFANAQEASDRWIEDGSFLRLQNVELGFTLPARVTRGLGAGAEARLYVNGQNLHTWTSYTGWDPEALGPGVLQRGVDEGGIYPNVRQVTVGLRLNL
jgi:TonB-linked SusC/RagA family outer membrane protein